MIRTRRFSQALQGMLLRSNGAEELLVAMDGDAQVDVALGFGIDKVDMWWDFVRW